MATLNLSKMKYMSETNLKKFANLIISLSSQVTDIENRCIKPYVDGELYPRGSYVSHDGYIYMATATNQDSAFDETHWDKLSDDFDELTVADIEAMLGLSQEQLETMANLIADTEVRLDKTYSSSKIYQNIQQCLNDSKSYTLKEIAKLNGSSYKVVTSTSEMTSESIIYLLASGNTYDMYIVEENGATTKIGDMDVNLDNYFTKAEIEADYLKKADADGKFATIDTVDGKANTTDLTTHTDNTDIHVTTTDKTKWDKVADKVDKTSILTANSSSATDDQLYSAKTVNDILSTVTGITNVKIYCLLSQLGITTPCTIKDIWDKMPSGSITIIDVSSAIITDLDAIRIALGIKDGDKVYGILTVVKLYERTTLKFIRARTAISLTPDTFIGYCKGDDCTLIKWKRIAFTTGVVDVGVTTITPVNSAITGTIEYTVKNGICYVSMKDLMSTISSTGLLISTAMPKPSINCNAVSVNASGNIARIYIDKNTANLNGDFYQKNATSNCSFSYPVKE